MVGVVGLVNRQAGARREEPKQKSLCWCSIILPSETREVNRTSCVFFLVVSLLRLCGRIDIKYQVASLSKSRNKKDARHLTQEARTRHKAEGSQPERKKEKKI